MSLLPENHLGIIWMMMCVVILTLFGVFLSLLIDARFASSSKKDSVQSGVVAQQLELDGLRSDIASAELRLYHYSSLAEVNSSILSEILPQISALEAQISVKEAYRDSLTKSILEQRSEFDGFREKYRIYAWHAARGEKLGTLITKSGRQYDGVSISSVTPLGLIISHSSGTTRVPFEDLDIEFQRRFQWTEELRDRSIAQTQSENSKTNSRLETTDPVDTAAHLAKPADRSSELIDMRANDVLIARAVVSKLRREYYNAINQNRFGRQKSMPGSLRTWAEQSKILEARLQRAVAQLSIAIENLRVIDPGHSALNEWDTDFVE